LGFNEECIGSYTENAYGSATKKLQFFYHPMDVNDDFVFISTPTFSQSFRWFREKYNLDHEINKHNNFESYMSRYGTNGKYEIIEEGLETYEEAELVCLNKLIEIIKK
jgi:hypothetical protein